MRPIVTDGVAWSVCLYVGRSFCHSLEPCKTAEPIEMPFGAWTRVGRGKHVLDGGPDQSTNFWNAPRKCNWVSNVQVQVVGVNVA